MYILTELVGVLSEVLIICLLIQGVFPERGRPRWVVALAYFLYGAGLAALSFLEGAAIWRIAYCGVGIVLLTVLLYRAGWLPAVFVGATFCVTYMMIDVCVMQLASLLHIDSGRILSLSVARCVYIVTTHILLLAAISIVLCFVRSQSSAITFSFVLVLAPGYLISILLGVSFCRYLQTAGEDLPLPFLFASLALLYMNIVLVFYAQQAKRSADQRRETELAEHHYKLQAHYYAQLQSEQEEARALFHGISKRMQAMNALLHENSPAQAVELLAETRSLYANIGNVVDVGNSILSAILNEYRNRAEKESIAFSFSVSVPAQLPIPAVDCYILLGNTLDNALEGALSAPEGARSIHLQLRQHQRTLFYKLENTCTEAHATRKRSKGHGYGLQNVQKCVEKHAGEMVTTYENGKFTFTSRITCDQS